jgi:hypothetical protein
LRGFEVKKQDDFGFDGDFDTVKSRKIVHVHERYVILRRLADEESSSLVWHRGVFNGLFSVLRMTDESARNVPEVWLSMVLYPEFLARCDDE